MLEDLLDLEVVQETQISVSFILNEVCEIELDNRARDENYFNTDVA